MPAAANTELFTSTIPNLSGGVSQQVTERRPENMVEDMINCIPSVIQGVMRRNPIKSSVELLTEAGGAPINTDRAYMYMYDRGNFIEKYLIVVPGDGRWYIYAADTTTGVPIAHSTQTEEYLINNTLYPSSEVFKCLTIADHTFIVNKSITVEMDSTHKSPGKQGYEDYSFYWITRTTAYPVGGTSDELEGYKYTLNGHTNS